MRDKEHIEQQKDKIHVDSCHQCKYNQWVKEREKKANAPK